MSSIPIVTDVKLPDVLSTMPVKRESTDFQSGSLPQQAQSLVKDTDSISEISKYLSEAKIDIATSNANYDGKNLDFNLTFRKSSTETMTTQGSYNSSSQEFTFSANYSFKRYMLVDGVMKEVPLEAKINNKSSDVSSVSTTVEQSQQKEDVFKILSKIVSRIVELSGNDTKKLTGVTFNVEDLIGLAQVGDSKTAKLLKELINSAIFTSELKQMIKEKAKNQEDVNLTSAKQVDDKNIKSMEFSSSSEFTITINEANASNSNSQTGL